jgi:hypothetical protein
MKLLLCIALSIAAGWAQSPRREWTSLNGLSAGAEIRVQLTGGKTVRGFFQRATAEALVVNAARSEEMVARGDVKRVQLKQVGHRGRNTLIGLAVGAGGGLAAGAAADANASDSGSPTSARRF